MLTQHSSWHYQKRVRKEKAGEVSQKEVEFSQKGKPTRQALRHEGIYMFFSQDVTSIMSTSQLQIRTGHHQ